AWSGPRSFSIIASARSIPAVIPAEVHTGPSMMKMRSSSTFTFGNRDCSSRARFQCVLARRPSSRPASARMNAPVQIAATRRHRPKARRTNFDKSGVRGFGAAARDQCIEIGTAEPIRHDAHPDRGADGAAGLGQQTHVIDRLAHLPIREFEGGDHGADHHREAGEDDETDALHGTALSVDVLKPRSYDI